MKIIFGLGNPGREYRETRHNIGFKVVEKLSSGYRIRLDRCKFSSLLGEGKIEKEKVILAKPLTFMNEVGKAFLALKESYGIEPQNILVVTDDADLSPGRIKILPQGGGGGHKGLLSIIENLKSEEFPRLRIGIGRPSEKISLTEWVLEEFSSQENPLIEKALENACGAVELWVKEGIESAMNRFNRKGEKI